MCCEYHNGILSANFNTLYDLSQKQFAHSSGLHLNSSDWRPYIKPGKAKYFDFLLTGVMRTTTKTKTNNKSYQQAIQFSEYKRAENSLLLLFLRDVPEKEIIEFLATFLYNTRTKCFCTCPAFKFWGFEYILTRKNSVLGPGEYRYPVVRNPYKNGVLCKHLWIIFERLKKKQLQLAEGLVPFYRRAFGVDNPSKFKRYKYKELGARGIKEVFAAAKEDIEWTKNAKIRDIFSTLSNKYLNIPLYHKPKTPQVMDQKTEEKKEKGLEPFMRGINRINKKYAGKEDTSGLDMETLRGIKMFGDE